MKYLLDTSVLIQSLLSRPRLSYRALRILEAESSELYLSAVSTWEITIKAETGKLELPEPTAEFYRRAMQLMDLRSLEITPIHALAVGELPFHHRDPFDRMLIAQARVDGLTLLTGDAIFRKYEVAQIHCGR